MTERLYWKDAYIKDFEASVVSAGPEGVVLDKTAFYPTGGGQANDTGELLVDGMPYKVDDVRKSGDDIVHILDKSGDIKPGGRAIGKIDWKRRYSLMKYHTTIHILSSLVLKKYGGKSTGNMLYPDKAHIDFDFPQLNRELGIKIVEETQSIIDEGHAVTSRLLAKEEAASFPGLVRTQPGEELVKSLANIRIVEIEGVDLQADGGTHVRNTSEIGAIKLSSFENKGAHRKRIEIKIE
ncbi:MAG: alanyl-tRNA editing protein [Candidatus Marsarchaeota archaeon]|jgi:misacylated tRNA(Ala) deacylase|nr:alanyl-tRNA editing protein [Candidatus Marsarchaeota archaeon]